MTVTIPNYQLHYELKISMKSSLMRLKAKLIVTSKKSRVNNLIFLVEFLLKFTSNNGFQLLFLDVLLNCTPEKDRSD